MIGNYKIVAVTPSGRKRYLEILYKYLCKNKHILDRWDLWVNTENESDLSFIRELGESDDFVNIVYPSWPYERNTHPNLSITPFWNKATDSDTIYIRFDDDIVFIDDKTIENLVKFRIENPDYFFIYPFIINNTHHSRNLQERGLATKEYGIVTDEDIAPLRQNVALNNPNFAASLHRLFIDSYKSLNYKYLMTEDKIVWNLHDVNKYHHIENGGPQISINCVCWFGNEMKKITPLNGCFIEGNTTQSVLTDEEAWLTIVETRVSNRCSCTAPNTLVVHFAFNTQLVKDNMNGILEEYKTISIC